MAEVAAVWSRGTDPRWATVTWTAVGDADTFEEIRIDERPLDIVMQLGGTISSQTVALGGSNDGTNFVNLSDIGGTEIGLTAAGVVGAQIAPLYLKPSTSGGSSSSSNVTLLLRFMD